MSHQPFEDWILEHNASGNKDRQLLEDHLNQCIECRKLYEGLNSYERVIRSAKPVLVPEGFNYRWRTNFQQKRLEAQRNQSRRFLWMMILLVALSVLALFFHFATNFSLWDAIISISKGTVSVLNTTVQIQAFIQPVFESRIGIPVLIFLVGLAFIGISFISSVWLTVIWRYSIKGVA